MLPLRHREILAAVLGCLVLLTFYPSVASTAKGLLVSSAPYAWTFDNGNITGWVPVVGWDIYTNTTVHPQQSCQVVNGEYSLDNCEPFYRLHNFTDFIFEAQVRVVSNPQIWGIGFRENPAGPYYANAVSQTGDPYTLAQGYDFEFLGSTPYLYKCQDDPTVDCKPLASASPNTNIYAENTLRVVAIGSDMKLFLNDTQIMEVTDSQFSQGLIRLYCLGCTANFDNVAIFPVQSTQTSTHSGSSGSSTLSVNLRSTSTSISCNPTSVVIGQTTTCTATVTDVSPGTASTPTGNVTWTSSSTGSFNNTVCVLSGTGVSASCSVSYTPQISGPQVITAAYGGEAGSTVAGLSTFVVSGNPSSNNLLLVAGITGGTAFGVVVGAVVTILLKKRRTIST